MCVFLERSKVDSVDSIYIIEDPIRGLSGNLNHFIHQMVMQRIIVSANTEFLCDVIFVMSLL